MQNTQSPTPAWFTDRDLANRYSVSRITIWRWARNGVIPPSKKLGPNTSRWSAAEIDAHDKAKMEAA